MKPKSDTYYSSLFCTPPSVPENENEIRNILKMEQFQVPCSGLKIRCYSAGSGPNVIVCHGWGSRAGHLLLMARMLEKSGFRAVIFDAPGHSTIPDPKLKRFSTMFEFGKALGAVSEYIKDVYCIIGHSLGAMAAVFTMAGYPDMNRYSVCPEKAVLINCPCRVSDVTANFSRTFALDSIQRKILENSLESRFSMKIDNYSCIEAIPGIKADLIYFQDKSDEYFHKDERLTSYISHNGSAVILTEGLGHEKVLGSRQVFKSILTFLTASSEQRNC